MSTESTTVKAGVIPPTPPAKTVMQRFLDGVEKVGNMVPHPVVIFLILIGIVVVLSAVLSAFGTRVTFHRINADTHEIETATTAIRSLLNAEGSASSMRRSSRIS